MLVTWFGWFTHTVYTPLRYPCWLQLPHTPHTVGLVGLHPIPLPIVFLGSPLCPLRLVHLPVWVLLDFLPTHRTYTQVPTRFTFTHTCMGCCVVLHTHSAFYPTPHTFTHLPHALPPHTPHLPTHSHFDSGGPCLGSGSSRCCYLYIPCVPWCCMDAVYVQFTQVVVTVIHTLYTHTVPVTFPHSAPHTHTLSPHIALDYPTPLDLWLVGYIYTHTPLFTARSQHTHVTTHIYCRLHGYRGLYTRTTVRDLAAHLVGTVTHTRPTPHTPLPHHTYHAFTFGLLHVVHTVADLYISFVHTHIQVTTHMVRVVWFALVYTARSGLLR